MEATTKGAVQAAQARIEQISAELLTVTDRMNALRPHLAERATPTTPGEQLDRLLSGAPGSNQEEFTALSQRARVLEQAQDLARQEWERLVRQRSALLIAAAQPDLLKLKRAACDALDALARALDAVDDAHMELARQGAELSRGFVLIREGMTASDLQDLAKTFRRELDREEWGVSQGVTTRRRIRMLTSARVDGKARQPGDVFDCPAHVAALAVIDGWAETASATVAA